MKLSVEISMYPLKKDFEEPILHFIHRLRTYEDIELHSNAMSTQIFGTYDRVMEILQKEMKTALLEEETAVMVLKIVNINLKG